MRLIDADDLLAEYDRQHEGEPGKARKLIEDAPTIDRPTRSQFKRMAVQLGYERVVHCKGCQYWGNEETKVATVCEFPRVQLFCVCDVLKRMRKAGNCMTNEDFFCAAGERRADFVDDNKIGERKADENESMGT